MQLFKYAVGPCTVDQLRTRYTLMHFLLRPIPPTTVLKTSSLCSFQLIVGILFVVIGSLNINHKHEQMAAIVINDIIVVLIFIISLMNVIISAFGMEYSSQPLRLLDRGRYDSMSSTTTSGTDMSGSSNRGSGSQLIPDPYQKVQQL